MSEIKDRIRTYRNDVLILLEGVTRTAQMHASPDLASALSHLARAQVLFTEELDTLGLSDSPELEEARSLGDGEATAVEGILGKRKRDEN